jgi:NADH-ubiquinone oxidoreductase chain 1
MTGSLRGVAQTISYEIRLALLVLVILVYLRSLSLDSLVRIKTYFSLALTAPFLLRLWFLSRLAETNRTPFDFAEGERELVSGFNTEYGARGFAIIFIAEYGRIYFLRIVTRLIFCERSRFFILSVITTRIVFV